jgi:hypothetical protein
MKFQLSVHPHQERAEILDGREQLDQFGLWLPSPPPHIGMVAKGTRRSKMAGTA